MDYRNGEKYALVEADGAPKVRLPAYVEDNLDPMVADAFQKYWFDPVSAILQESDMILVQRYFMALDRYVKLSYEADLHPICTGSQGQDVLNPKYTAANMSLQAAERLERQLGIGPSNRSKLGIELIAADRAGRPPGFKRGPDDGTGNITIVPDDRPDPREVGRDELEE
jgi:P27 family predicted phage terminase small subunit